MPETKCCYICESLKTNTFLKELNGVSWPIIKCKECRLIWVEDNNNDILSLYDRSYFYSKAPKIGYANYLADEKNHRLNARDILKEVDKRIDLTKKRILDIGSAFGFLLDEARMTKLCDTYGVETSNYACEYAKEKLGLNVIQGELEQSRFDIDFFDVVFMIGTIEHLVSPKSALEHIRRILKPDGLIVITTVDTNGLIPLYSIKPPEHLFYFNHENITLLLEKKGYKIFVCEPYFVKYNLNDLLKRISEFTSLSVFASLSRIAKKSLPSFSLKIPTNEMLIIAKKDLNK